jgi:putative exporter of polyketide antibiotics
MRAIVAILMAAALVAACGPRKVEVSAEPATSAQNQVSLHVTNNSTQAVNVYVVSGGNPIFVGQVSANSSQHLTVAGVAAGSVVTLRATTTDGAQTYTKDNVSLSGMYAWQVP